MALVRLTSAVKEAAERIDTALDLLREHGLARLEQQQTGGRPAERWHAVERTEQTEQTSTREGLSSVPYVPSTPSAARAPEPATDATLPDADAEQERLAAKGLLE